MTYDEFVDRISIAIQEELQVNEDMIRMYPKGYVGENKMDRRLVRSMNDAYYKECGDQDILQGDMLAIVARSDISMLAVPVPLEQNYEYFKYHDFDADAWDAILEQIRMGVNFHHNMDRRLDPDKEGLDYETEVKPRLFLLSMSSESYAQVDEDVISIQYGDIVLIACMDLDRGRDKRKQMGLSHVDRNDLPMWGLTEDQVLADAFEVMMREYPPVLINANDMSKEIDFLNSDESLDEIAYILTSKQHICGACAVFYPGVAEKIYKAMGNKPFAYYPLSHHRGVILEDNIILRRFKEQLVRLLVEDDGNERITDKIHIFDGQTFRVME